MLENPSAARPITPAHHGPASPLPLFAPAKKTLELRKIHR